MCVNIDHLKLNVKLRTVRLLECSFGAGIDKKRRHHSILQNNCLCTCMGPFISYVKWHMFSYQMSILILISVLFFFNKMLKLLEESII